MAKQPAPSHLVLAAGNIVPLNRSMRQAQKSGEIEPLSYEALIADIAISQSKTAFMHLFEYFAPRLKSFLLKGGLSNEQAEEITQETLLTVWQKAKSFNPDKASASTWIYTIARNKKIDLFRKIKRPECDPLDPLLNQDVSENSQLDQLSQRQHAETIAEGLKDLPEEQSFLIKKAFYEDKTHQAIAEELSIPLGTVKSRIRLGMERLRYAIRNKVMREGI